MKRGILHFFEPKALSSKDPAQKTVEATTQFAAKEVLSAIALFAPTFPAS
jgi:hypothetical protein